MRIFIDTNILLDLFTGPTRPNYEHSARLIGELRKQNKIQPLISVQSITDISYTLTEKGQQKRDHFYKTIKDLLGFITLVTITPDESKKALADEPKDFEDHQQILCAEDNHCSWFVTGDKKLIKRYNESNEHIQAITPEDFIELS